MNCIKYTKFYLCLLKNQVPKHILIASNRKSSSSKSDEDVKAQSAKKRLLSLLSEMTDTKDVSNNKSALNLAKPKARPYIKKKKEKVPESNTQISHEMMHAVKDIATAAGEDAVKVETELTGSIQVISQIDKEMDEPDTEFDEKVVEKELGEQMISAVKAVASSVAGESIEIKSELTKKLLSMSAQSHVTDNKDIEKLFHGMKVETKESFSDSQDRTATERRRLSTNSLSRWSVQPTPDRLTVNIFDAAPLNVFTQIVEEKRLEKELTFWNQLEKKELKSLVQFAPTSSFEEMIHWTERGKFWKFPIDNQCDMGKEENVGFHEHVFLEQHLEGFPKKGPIRHFMELVCTGLSKNPYITAERKKENIEWFRHYFKEKEHILREYDVLDDK